MIEYIFVWNSSEFYSTIYRNRLVYIWYNQRTHKWKEIK